MTPAPSSSPRRTSRCPTAGSCSRGWDPQQFHRSSTRRRLIAFAGAKELAMSLYLTHFSYTPETWARLTKSPEDRREAARKYIESVGGKLHGFWYAFGPNDGYNLWEAPDN